MLRRVTFRSALMALLIGAFAAGATAGLDAESNTDGYDPAAESYRINEARRLNAISRQLELKYRMLELYGFDPANPPIEQPIGHESGQVGPNRWMYRPLYGEEVPPLVEVQPVPEVKPVPELLPAPVPAGPLLIPRAPAPAGALPRDHLPPPDDAGQPGRPARGPREF